MDESLIMLAFLLIGVLIVIPIILLVKMLTLGSKLESIKDTVSELTYKLSKNQQSQVTIQANVTEILNTVRENVSQKTTGSYEISKTTVQPITRVDSVVKEEPKVEVAQPVAEPVIIPQVQPIKPIVEEKTTFAAATIKEEPKVYRKPIVVEAPSTLPPPFVDRKLKETPPEKNIFEKLLSENLLSKIGIVTLVLGIGFFVKYAIDQEWINEIGRVGIGLLTGGILIGVAHKLRSKYELFSSILVGGGIAVFYITITIAFREYQIFSQTVAFVLLIIITILSVIFSLYYDRKELAIFSLLGGFASPLMISTGAGNYIVLFSYILILNTGMLFISFKKNWRIIGILAYSLTLMFVWAWLFNTFTNEYIGAAIFATLFFFQFYTLALIDHFRSDYKVTAYQSILILTNNLSAFVAFLYIFDTYEYDFRGITSIGFAVVNALVMLLLYKKSKIDKTLIYLVIAIVLSFVSLAIPIALHGHVITMFWAAEMVLLLWLWQKSNIQVFRIGFLVLGGLVIGSYLMDINYNYNLYLDQHLNLIINRIFVTGVVVVAGFVASLFLLKKEDPESEIEFRGFEICTVKTLTRVLQFLILVSTFIVPFLELNYQIEMNLEKQFSSFRYLALATYTAVYGAVLCVVYWKNQESKTKIYALFLLSLGLFAVIYSNLVSDLRFDIFTQNAYPVSYFLIHLISLPATILVITYLVRNIKQQHAADYSVFGWILAILCMITLSVELDNISVLLFANADNYDSLLYDVHTFGYPILWGLVAMLLMIWGLKGKEVLLRKVSLFFFGITIIKFYAYDVWHISQGSRIVSFVILGLIFLLVSFLQQKIKVLVKGDEKISDNDDVDDIDNL